MKLQKDNLIRDKSYEFSLKIIKIYKNLVDKKSYELANQLLRSGTSIGANVEEAIGAQSTKEFLAKLSIAYKEARETHYWIRLLRDAGYIDESSFNELSIECESIVKIIAKIRVTILKKSATNERG
jgi:four helix bundle protein